MAAGASESQGTQQRNQHLGALPGSMQVWIYDLFAANTCGIQKCEVASCKLSTFKQNWRLAAANAGLPWDFFSPKLASPGTDPRPKRRA